MNEKPQKWVCMLNVSQHKRTYMHENKWLLQWLLAFIGTFTPKLKRKQALSAKKFLTTATIMFITPKMPAAVPTHNLPAVAVEAAQTKTLLILARRASLKTWVRMPLASYWKVVWGKAVSSLQCMVVLHAVVESRSCMLQLVEMQSCKIERKNTWRILAINLLFFSQCMCCILNQLHFRSWK